MPLGEPIPLYWDDVLAKLGSQAINPNPLRGQLASLGPFDRGLHGDRDPSRSVKAPSSGNWPAL
nr:hypothetical protein SHINE37_90011 [Rhizobiaceae bacterium]